MLEGGGGREEKGRVGGKEGGERDSHYYPPIYFPTKPSLNGPSYTLKECSELWGKRELVLGNVLNTLRLFSMLLVAVQK